MTEDSNDQTELELLRTDYSHLLREACQTFVDAATDVEDALAGGLNAPGACARGDRGLVRMALAAHQAARLIIPSPDAMEYFGLPRSVTSSGLLPEPTIRVQDPGRETWDFRPWLSEKLSHLRENYYALLESVELAIGPSNQETAGDSGSRDPDELPPEVVRQRLLERASYELRATRNYARDILNAMDTMGLTVIDWRLANQPGDGD